MVNESKEFLTYFGIPFIEAPSEGEATAAHLTNTGQFMLQPVKIMIQFYVEQKISQKFYK